MLLWCTLFLIYLNTALGSKCGKGQYKSDFLSGRCAQCPKILQECESQEIDDARRCFIACRTFKSDFLSGGCALCPPKLKSCENEQLEDSIRCFKACGKILSTPPAILDPTPTRPLRTSSGPSPRTATQAKRGSSNVSKSPYAVVSKDALTISRSSDSSNKQPVYSNRTDIIFGISVTVLALILVIVACLALWWKRRGNDRNNEQRSSSNHYGPVRSDSRSNSGQSTNGEASETRTSEEVVDIENNGSSLSMRMSSVSQEDFENMPEEHV